MYAKNAYYVVQRSQSNENIPVIKPFARTIPFFVFSNRKFKNVGVSVCKTKQKEFIVININNLFSFFF